MALYEASNAHVLFFLDKTLSARIGIYNVKHPLSKSLQETALDLCIRPRTYVLCYGSSFKRYIVVPTWSHCTEVTAGFVFI